MSDVKKNKCDDRIYKSQFIDLPILLQIKFKELCKQYILSLLKAIHYHSVEFQLCVKLVEPVQWDNILKEINLHELC